MRKVQKQFNGEGYNFELLVPEQWNIYRKKKTNQQINRKCTHTTHTNVLARMHMHAHTHTLPRVKMQIKTKTKQNKGTSI